MKTSKMLRLSVLGIMLVISGCSADSSNGSTKKQIKRTPIADSTFKPTELEDTVDRIVEALGNTEPQTLRFNINLKALVDYWEPVVIGSNRAMGELDVDGSVESVDLEDIDAAVQRQIAMVFSNIEQGTDGLGIAPVEAPVAKAIDAAIDAEIPVVTLDSDLSDSKRDFYVGTINSEAGKTAANSLLSLITTEPGTIVILGHDDPGWVDGYNRTIAAKNVLEDAGYTVVVRKTDWSRNGEAHDLDFLINAIDTAIPPVVGMLGMFSNAYRCALAAESVGMTTDDVAIATFDFDAKTVEYMRNGLIKVTHAQRQYYMGYLTPYILYGINALGLDKTRGLLNSVRFDDERINTGLDVVSSEKLDDYYAFLDSLGVGSS